MEKFKKSVLDYINSNSRFALLIDGEWGIGKTHFIKNEIIRALEGKKSEKNQEEIVPIYVSLYGVTDYIDLKKKLNFAILSSKGFRKVIGKSSGIFKKGGKAIESVASNFLPVKGLTYGIEELMSIVDETQLNSDSRNIVLFIDDLERLGKELSLTDCLGLINSEYMEKMNCKVVFITNEKEIIELEEFNKIKEKTIDKTMQYTPNAKVVLKGILNDSKNDFLKENSDWIAEIITFYNKSTNIRTFYSTINNFIDLQKKLKSGNFEDDMLSNKDLQKSLFLNILVITEVYKSGDLTKDNVSKLAPNLRSIKSGNMERISKNEESINDIIIEKYETLTNQYYTDFMFYFDAINLYILSAVFDENKFLDSYKSWISAFKENPDLDYYPTLYDFRKMSDIEIKDRQKAILNSVKKDKYQFEDLLRIYKLLLEFEKMDVLLIETEFKETLDKKIKEKYFDLDDISDVRIESLFFIINDDNKFKELIELQDSITDLSLEKRKSKSEKLLIAIFEDNSDLLQKYNAILFQYPIFESLNNDLMDQYIFGENNRADNLWLYIRGNCNKGHNPGIKEQEMLHIKSIIKKIDGQDKSKMQKVDKFKLKQLIEILKELK